MPDPDPPPTPPTAPDSPGVASPITKPSQAANPAARTVRTYKDPIEAESAAKMLRGEGIEVSVLELALPPGKQRVTGGAVRLVVDAEDASKAEILLHRQTRLARSPETAQESEAARRERIRDRLSRDRAFYKKTQRRRKGAAGVAISLGLLGAFGAVAYLISSFFKDEEVVEKQERRPRLASQDINGDRKVDWKRYIDVRGAPIREEFDFNFDGLWDTLHLYDFGRLTERRRDLDQNGIYDEYHYYDYLGRPFYSQIIQNGKGGATKRSFYRDEQEFPDFEWPEEITFDPESQPDGGTCWPWKVLTDEDSDGNFDKAEELNLKGEIIATRKMEKGDPEGGIPVFPTPPGAVN